MRNIARFLCYSQGRNQKFISRERVFLSYPFRPFLLSSFPLSSPPPRSAPPIQLRICGALLAPQRGEYLQPPEHRKRIFGVFKAQGTCLVAANVILFVLNEICKKQETHQEMR